MNFRTEVRGFEKLERNVRALPGLLAHRVQGRGLLAAAAIVRNEARALVPVDTGALRDSIRAGVRSQEIYTLSGKARVPGAAAQTRAGGRGARHAHLIELGTVKMTAKPFLEPAVHGTSAEQVAAIAAAMKIAFARLNREIQTGRTSAITRRLVAADT